MSWKEVRIVYEAYPGLPPAQKAVLVALAFRCSLKGQCNPSVGRLANDTGYSERSVRVALADLERCGILAISRTDGGRRRTNSYRINPAVGAPFADEKPCSHDTVSSEKPCRIRTEILQNVQENPAAAAPEPILTVFNREEGHTQTCGKLTAEDHLREIRQCLRR